MGNRECYIGVDIGGTKIAVAILDEAGKLLSFNRVATEASDGREAIENNMLVAIRTTLAHVGGEGLKVKAIGVGVPGIVDYDSGVLAPSGNLSGVSLAPREYLEPVFGVRVFVENDANLAAFGEYTMGVGLGARSMVFVAIGTGAGCGIIINGHIYRGYSGYAGECGRMIVDPRQIGVMLPDFGCWETTVSGIGIAKAAREALRRNDIKSVMTSLVDGEVDSITAETVFVAANAGDAVAKGIVEKATTLLAYGVVNISVLLDPEIIVLGGGVMPGFAPYIEKIKETVAFFRPMPPRVVESKLGTSAGAIGAAAFALAENTRFTGHRSRQCS